MADSVTQLLSVKEAQERLLKPFSTTPVEAVPSTRAAGRVLARAITAPSDLPRFSNSSMDGFAVLSGDLIHATPEKPAELVVVADIPAGIMLERRILPGECARIMTGAPLPPGADAVVPVEQTNFERNLGVISLPAQVQVRAQVRAGDYVRPAGEDLRQGDVVLEPGLRLRPVDIGFLAMLGVRAVEVFRRPRVAILSSGDELVSIESELGQGKIFDSNAYMLQSAIEGAGGEALLLETAPDQEEAIRSRLDQAAAQNVDLIVSSAGVSVGAYDFVRSVVISQGRLDFWRVNMRPGKPLAFGFYRETPFIGLPGNPVSAYVGFEVFVRPALNKMHGLKHAGRLTKRVKLAEAVESDGRESFLRAWVSEGEPGAIASLTGHQGSGNLYSLVQANALIRVPSGVKFLPEGAEVEAWMLDDLQ